MTTATLPGTINPETTSRLAQVEAILNTQLFFIVGCQKSGTTWLSKLLDGHPDIRSHGEANFGSLLLPILQQVLKAYNEQQKAGDEGRFKDDDLVTLFRTAVGLRYLEWVGDANVKAIGEKTPEHALSMPVLVQAFPNAKFVHITRDGRDVCVSGWFHNLRQNEQAFRAKFPDLNAYIRYTVREHWVRYIQLAQAFGRVNPETIL